MYSAELSILLHRALVARVEVLMNLLATDGWQGQPEGVHDTRVASRRVRAVLDMVEPALYPRLKRQGLKLKRLTRTLGRTREMDVHIAILQEASRQAPALADSPAMEHVLEAIDGHRRRALKTMQKGLDRLNLKSLPHLLQVPSLPDPFRVDDLIGDIWSCLAPWLDGAFPGEALLDTEDVLALHALRIRVKRLRYALEVLAPGFRTAPEAHLRHLRALQTALGEHHDLATLTAQLRDLHQGLEARGRRTLAAGTLDILFHLGEDQAIAFEQFRALAVAAHRPAFIGSLRQELGLEQDADGSQPS